MSENVTLIGMLLISLACSFLGGIYWKIKGKRLVILGSLLFVSFWFISIGRLIFLRTSEIYTYDADIRLLVFDVLFGIMGVLWVPFLFPVFLEKLSIQKYAWLFVLTGITVFGGGFLYQYAAYKNINSAVYHLLLPEWFAFLGTAIMILYYILICCVEKRFSYTKRIDEKDKKKKIIVTGVVSITGIFTMFAYPAFETFITNADEFTFEAKSVAGYYIFYMLILCSILVLCIGKLHDKAWNAAITSVFALLLASYLQQMFLNGALFLMDGEEIKISAGRIIINSLIWIGIFAGCFIAGHFLKNNWKDAVLFLSGAIMLMQLTGGISLIVSHQGQITAKNEQVDYFSTEGLYEVASEENVIVFVLDKYDEEYMEEVLAAEPDFLTPLEGFTYFQDTVSQFSRTYPSITYMLTNRTFFDLPRDEKYADWAFDHCSFYKELENNGYESYFYEEEASRNIGGNAKIRAANYIEQGSCIREKKSLPGCIKSIHLMSCFRGMPYILKDYYSYTAEQINNLIIREREWKDTPYVVDDAKIKEQLDAEGLSVGKDKKAFRFIHMFGAHPPYSLNRNGERVKYSKDLYLEQYMGSMQIVYNYLQRLREIGAYENSTIVITADHGENFENGNVLPETANIILFIKPKGVGSGELQYSDVYASQDDLLPTLSALMDINADMEAGIDLFSDAAKSKERERYHYFHVTEDTVQTFTRTYIIRGNSLDFNNWTATEEYQEFR